MANTPMTELEIAAFFNEWQQTVGPFRVQRTKQWLADSGFHLATKSGDHVVLVNDAGEEQVPDAFFATLGVQTGGR